MGNATVTPITQPAIESLRNALAIAQARIHETRSGMDAATLMREVEEDYEILTDVARLIQDALGKLSEPNEAAIAAAETFVPGYITPFDRLGDRRRKARDCAAAILAAQLKGAS